MFRRTRTHDPVLAEAVVGRRLATADRDIAVTSFWKHYALTRGYGGSCVQLLEEQITLSRGVVPPEALRPTLSTTRATTSSGPTPVTQISSRRLAIALGDPFRRQTGHYRVEDH